MPLSAIHYVFSDVEVMLSSDVSTMVNTGCFLVKRTPWTRQFLRRWLSCGGFDNELYSPRGDIAQNDQLGFDCAYR